MDGRFTTRLAASPGSLDLAVIASVLAMTAFTLSALLPGWLG